ncbi:MAG: metallophosphoesterase family protein [Candidatus Kariarchaeaceae archaeon]|jgi:3',5'-cyclic AMP phosphodiesterase CpdA
MKFLLFSDVHIGGKFNEAMFLKGVDYINNSDADYVIFCGDLTDNGTLAEYEMAQEYFSQIKPTVLMVPGNHDVKNVGDKLWEEMIGPRYFVHTDPVQKVKILGLDSNEPDKNTGRMGEKAISRIYDEFQDITDDWIQVLVFHHQSLPIKFTGRERSALNDAGDVIKAILDCNIDLVFNGHRHISNVYSLTDGDIVTLIINSGTMSCQKTRYREEYSITEVYYPKNGQKGSVDVLLLNDQDTWKNNYHGYNRPIDQNITVGRQIARIAQIGNTDISNDFNLENLARGIKIINNLDDCDLVIHNGDVTKSSYPEEFDMANALLSQIDKPFVVVPGPRDYYSLGAELFERHFGDTNPVYENDNIKLMGYNSCVLEESYGRLGRSRTERLVNELKSLDKIGTAAFHHTIIPLPRTKHESELEDAGDLLAKIVDNRIDLILTGAKNRAGCWQVNDTVFVNVGTLSSKNIVTSKGNSFNIINIFETDRGKFYKVDECFVETGDLVSLGRLYINDLVPN